jgi:predicted transposase YdaD
VGPLLGEHWVMPVWHAGLASLSVRRDRDLMAKRKRRRGDLTAQPHDAIIKFTFSQREHAAGLLRAALDPAVSSLVRWGTLKLETIHFVDRTLRGRYTDLFFSAKMVDEPIYMHVVLEHQSSVDPLMIFRMGSIMWRRWEQDVRDEPGRTTLPLIIPVLIHHSATGWTAATAFENLVVVPEQARAAAGRHIPSFEMKLVDVSRDPAGGLVMQALTDLGRVVLWCLSVAGDGTRFEAELDQLVAELNAIYATPREIDALVAVMRYLVATHREISAPKIAQLLETTARKGPKEINVDVLEELKREGRLEGRLEGEARSLMRQLAARFGRVPAEAKARILSAKEPTLARWSLRVLTAPTLDDVFGNGTATKKAVKKPAAPARRPAARRRVRTAR